MKRLIIEQSDDEFYTSHSGLALAGACINRHSDLGRQVGRLSRGGGQIADIDILRSYLGLLCLGKSDFQAITGMRDDDFFQQALGIGRVPSTERLRQRLDEAAADGLIPLVFRSSQSMLKQLGVKVSGYAGNFIEATSMNTPAISLPSRLTGALFGACIADALAMPVIA